MKVSGTPGQNERPRRRAAVLVFSALMIVFLLGMVALAVDVGYIMLVRTQLQVAADSAAMAAASCLGKPFEELYGVANEFAGYHVAGGVPVSLRAEDVEIGIWDADRRTFTPSARGGNAVRVTTYRDSDNGGEVALFFGRILGRRSFQSRASAVAVANPRDIAFVVDMSGSMNDDTEPCWSTKVINSTFAAEGYPTIGTELMQQLYEDFGFGSFPGPTQYVGEPWGVPNNKYAYAELTKDGGPLTKKSIPPQYRIRSTDNELIRKKKAYSAIIDFQLARLMPKAKPAVSSRANYAYWEKYLDYVIRPVKVKSSSSKPKPPKPKPPKPKPPKPKPPKPKPPKPPSPPKPKPPKPPVGLFLPSENPTWFAGWDSRSPDDLGQQLGTLDVQLAMAPGAWEGLVLRSVLGKTQPGTPPYNRGYLPPRQDRDRIYRFNNPNKTTFPSASSRLPREYWNVLGYITYVQFMMDHGRDTKPDGNTFVPLSRNSPHCPWHSEGTAGGTFSFPPRSQPVHAARRAIIAALQVVKERNEGVVPEQADWVSIISYDTLSGGGPVIEQSLTADYTAAMRACTRLQAVGDKGASTATEAGLLVARQHIRPRSEGGKGREATNKVVVLLTDGVPNLYVSSPGEINAFIRDNASADFYNNGAYWYDAPLMQAMQIYLDGWQLFPVGVGLGTDYDFMDRLARLGGTANKDGASPRGSGNPANYERQLQEIFERIITNPQVRLVQ